MAFLFSFMTQIRSVHRQGHPTSQVFPSKAFESHVYVSFLYQLPFANLFRCLSWKLSRPKVFGTKSFSSKKLAGAICLPNILAGLPEIIQKMSGVVIYWSKKYTFTLPV